MSCQIKENELFMSCHIQVTAITKLIKTTQKQKNNHTYFDNHALFKVTHSS